MERGHQAALLAGVDVELRDRPVLCVFAVDVLVPQERGCLMFSSDVHSGTRPGIETGKRAQAGFAAVGTAAGRSAASAASSPPA